MPEASESLTALQKVAAAQAASVSRFNTDLVRSAWRAIQQRRREARAADPAGESDAFVCAYIEELWTDHVIVSVDGPQPGGYLRIPYRVEAPGTAPEHVKFGAPEKVRVEYVAASARRRSEAVTDVLELHEAPDAIVLARRVRTMAGARRYRKPIGSQLGTGAPGGDALATVAKTGSRIGAQVTSDKLRESIQRVSEEKTYRGGKVFGDIGDEGKLKNALNQISRLPEGKRGAAAAEVVKAAQALGLTRLVPTSVKRLYRQYIAQSKIESPSKPSKVKGK